jgi:UDP-galactopyranose mutase
MRQPYDLVCLSHLRWDFVYQRPQHLLSRCATERRVFFVEEPVFDGPTGIDVRKRADGLHVAVPHLPRDIAPATAAASQRMLLDEMFALHGIGDHALWYYTPMALPFSRHLSPLAVVYDCMDELSAFRGAPDGLLDLERELIARADLVLTGGHSLYEAKRERHPNTHVFPSSVDVQHFAKARRRQTEPLDQGDIPHPRAGYYGVIDERMDLQLLDALASLRPDWQFVLIGPHAKIDPEALPRHRNIHYLGSKPYADLPAYLSGWDVAIMPFARNDATRFISPTKTPEYLAGGRPVVSTSIRDVVRPYGDRGLVHIADEPADFAEALDAARCEDHALRIRRVDAFLDGNTWDRTWSSIARLLDRAVAGGRLNAVPPLALRAASPVVEAKSA